MTSFIFDMMFIISILAIAMTLSVYALFKAGVSCPHDDSPIVVLKAHCCAAEIHSRLWTWTRHPPSVRPPPEPDSNSSSIWSFAGFWMHFAHVIPWAFYVYALPHFILERDSIRLQWIVTILAACKCGLIELASLIVEKRMHPSCYHDVCPVSGFSNLWVDSQNMGLRFGMSWLRLQSIIERTASLFDWNTGCDDTLIGVSVLFVENTCGLYLVSPRLTVLARLVLHTVNNASFRETLFQCMFHIVYLHQINLRSVLLVHHP